MSSRIWSAQAVSRLWGAQAVIFSVFFWSASFTWSQLALLDVSPWSLAFWRWLCAAGLFAVYLPLRSH